MHLRWGFTYEESGVSLFLSAIPENYGFIISVYAGYTFPPQCQPLGVLGISYPTVFITGQVICVPSFIYSRLRRAGYVARIEEGSGAFKILRGNHRERPWRK